MPKVERSTTRLLQPEGACSPTTAIFLFGFSRNATLKTQGKRHVRTGDQLYWFPREFPHSTSLLVFTVMSLPRFSHQSALSPQPSTSSGAITAVFGQTAINKMTSLRMSVKGTNSQAISMAITQVALFMVARRGGGQASKPVYRTLWVGQTRERARSVQHERNVQALEGKGRGSLSGRSSESRGAIKDVVCFQAQNFVAHGRMPSSSIFSTGRRHTGDYGGKNDMASGKHIRWIAKISAVTPCFQFSPHPHVFWKLSVNTFISSRYLGYMGKANKSFV